MKPLPPVKAQEKLPMVDLLTLVSVPEDPDLRAVILVRMRGDEIVRRRQVSATFLSLNEALDEYQRLATRVFYFGEGESLAEFA